MNIGSKEENKAVLETQKTGENKAKCNSKSGCPGNLTGRGSLPQE